MGNTLEVDEVNRMSSERTEDTEVILHVLAPPEGFCLGAVGIRRLSFGAACRASLYSMQRSLGLTSANRF